MATKPPKKSLSVRAAHDPKLLARVLANPALRSKLSDAQLPPAMRAKRALNARMNAPVVEGSRMTYGDAARTANAQTAVRYGGAEQALGTELGHAQGLQRDTGGWYEQYKADLAQHAQNVQNIGTAANTQLAGQQAGIKGLDQAALNAQQGAANTDAAARGATAGNLAPDASNASTVRQALLASMAGTQTGANAANSTYADTLAKVVAPGQKLQALAGAAGKVGDVRAKQSALASEKGAFNLTARQQIAGDELKNVLTGQALGLNTAKAQTSAQIAAARVGETARHNKAVENKPPTASEQKTQQQIDFFNKHGYYPPTGKPKTAKDKVKPGEGPEWLTNQQMGAGLTQVVKLKDFAVKAKTGQPFVPGHKPQGRVARAEAAKKIYANAPSLKDPALLSAALDAAYDGHLSSATVKKLISAGYKPKRVAQALGVQTAGQTKSHIPVKKI